MRAVLFDCDGTIADSCGLICDIMRRVFAEHGLPEPEDAETRGIIGLSLDVAIGRLHPTAEPPLLAAMVEGYRRTFRASRADERFRETLFPGMKALIDRLSAREDVLLAMVTGKSRSGVAAICETHDMEFHAVRTADDCPSKPHPAMVEECCAEFGLDPRHALVVGDSVFDIEMARTAGASALGVAWGTHEAAPLLASGAYAVAETVDELGAFIDAWLLDAPVLAERGQRVAVD
mgnify:CR=1 FL=1